jgi:RNA polymerase sigma-70 factor (ECF subfamily)
LLAFYLAAIESQEDRDLFTDLYNDYRDYMFHMANRILEDEYTAENIVHDAFVRMIENIDKFNLRNGHKTKGLIGIIVDGLAKDEYRRRKRIASLDDELEELYTPPPGIDDQVLQRDQYAQLLKYINQLDTIYSDTFLLKHEHQFTFKEIAEITGVPEATVRQRLRRAKIKLRTLLAKEEQMV